MRLYFVLAIVASGFASPLNAQGPPVVAVRFNLREPSYRTEYGPSISQIERKFGKFLADRLAQQMAYVRFDTSSNAQRTLVVALDRRDPASNAQRHEIGLYVRLVGGAATTPPEQYWVMFRPIDQYLARRGTPEQLLNELRVRFASGDLEALQSVLRSVPVASQAQLWLNPLAWILPFKRRDLCMDFETTLLVRGSIQSPTGLLHDEYIAKANREFGPATPPAALRDQVGNVMGSLTSQRGDLDALRQAAPNSIRIDGVYVDHYHKSDSACAVPAAPDSTAFSTAGRP
jgi:hypothetical protein